ncbi:MAG: YbaB/EbfC family nucleoid-associated protein [Rhodococcus sp.]|nr:YbaB/EbfC family nucleoid-associated protein [Rhodococcus sp. (in: high G+C Gram-positive bacteria)]
MVGQDRERLRAENDALNARVESMLTAFEEQTRQLGRLKESLAAIRAEGWSADNLVRVTANAGGIPVDVWIAPEAFKQSTPDRLAKSVAEASQHAARSAQEQAAAAVAPITGAADAMPDISDLTPGAPNMREVFDSFIPAPDERVPGPAAPEEAVDTWDETQSVDWLKDR